MNKLHSPSPIKTKRGDIICQNCGKVLSPGKRWENGIWREHMWQRYRENIVAATLGVLAVVIVAIAQYIQQQ